MFALVERGLFACRVRSLLGLVVAAEHVGVVPGVCCGAWRQRGGGGVRIRLRTYRVHCVGVTLLLLCCVCSARGYFRYLVALYYQPNKVSKHQSMDKKREEVEALRAKFGRDEE